MPRRQDWGVRAIDPPFRRIFPDIARAHPAGGSIVMNSNAKLLALDNAATPLGLKAMRELQEINPDIQGSTETTFYVLAVYFGSVNIRNSRYALACGLLADLVALVAAIFVADAFFH
jgi:spore maturation protein SpmA